MPKCYSTNMYALAWTHPLNDRTREVADVAAMASVSTYSGQYQAWYQQKIDLYRREIVTTCIMVTWLRMPIAANVATSSWAGLVAGWRLRGPACDDLHSLKNKQFQVFSHFYASKGCIMVSLFNFWRWNPEVAQINFYGLYGVNNPF